MANLYDPSSVGVTAGNLQNGGWYNGRQYWNGQVGDPGVIINPNQQGSGQPVSQTVQAQTNPANPAYIQQQTAAAQKANVAPTGQTSTPTTQVPTGGTATPTAGTGAGLGVTATTTTPQLQDLYNSLQKTEGITTLQNTITTKTSAYNSQISQINDNPYLSEANRTGRIEKLTTDFNNDIKNDQDALAMKQADVTTQLNLATQQFDINSKAASDALSTFNTLLTSGALSGASGTDIANIATSTGMSTSMVQAAIKAETAKDAPKPQVIQFNDGTNTGFVVVNPDTGAIISKQIVAAAPPTSASVAQEKLDKGGGTGTATENKATATENKATQVSDSNSAIISYTQDKAAQAAASPEDFITLLIEKYPLAGLSSADAQKIRKQTGQ